MGELTCTRSAAATTLADRCSRQLGRLTPTWTARQIYEEPVTFNGESNRTPCEADGGNPKAGVWRSVWLECQAAVATRLAKNAEEAGQRLVNCDVA